MSTSADSPRTALLRAFGGRLRVLREDCKIKQKDLAEHAALSNRTVSAKENGIGAKAPEWRFVERYVTACSELKQPAVPVDLARFDPKIWRTDHAALEQALEAVAGTVSGAGGSSEERGRQAPPPRPAAAPRQDLAGHTDVIAEAHQAHVAGIAPDRLLDRDQELAELARFCSSEHAYAWWQGQPWAGKTALLSWFSLHPPDGVDVASFFVIGRLVGQSDSSAFTSAMTEQLASIAGESSEMAPAVRYGNVLRLVQAAAQRLGRAGRRLLIVVDGLDEDTSAGTEQPSIASLLPRRPPPGVHVLIASRLSPGLADDVPGDHPLRLITPRQLAASAHAVGLRQAARNELARALRRPGIQRDILGLITASGGGLTGHDLEKLTQKPPYELEGQLEGVLGRTVASLTRQPAEPALPSERVYVFAHETLQEEAEHQYGASLTKYGDRLGRWAEQYRTRGWPADTPMYLVRGYPQLLASKGDAPGLLALATDSLRHQRMFQATGGDALALAEIAATAGLLARHDEPDLAALALLALLRDQLVHRYRRLPAALPIAWAAAGEPGRGIALAHCLPDLTDRAHALGVIAQAQATAGHHERAAQAAEGAEATARTIPDNNFRLRALAAAAEVWATLGNRERAAATASEAEDGAMTLHLAPLVPVLVLCLAARAWAALGDRERAVNAADAARNKAAVPAHPSALSEVAGAWAAAGEHVRAALAASAVEAITDKTEPYEAARAWAAAGDHDLAEQLARRLTYAPARDSATSDLVRALSASGQHDRAEQLAYRIDAPVDRVVALSMVADARAAAGHRQDAVSAAAAAEKEAGTITDPGQLAEALCAVASAWAAAGDRQRAIQAATAAQTRTWPASDPDDYQSVLAETAKALAAARDPGRAEQLAQAITNLRLRFDVLVLAAQASAVTGAQGQAVRLLTVAEAIARQTTNSDSVRESPYPEWEDNRPLMQVVAEAWASIGERGRGEQLADISIVNPGVYILLAKVQKLAADGENHTAEETAHSITDIPVRAVALALVAQRSAAGGDSRQATHIAQAISGLAEKVSDSMSRARILADACAAWAAAGNGDLAAQSARAAETAFTDPEAHHPDPEAARYFVIQRSCIMARAWALAGDRHRAVQAATTAETVAAEFADSGRQAQAQGQAVLAWVSAGDDYRAAQAMAAAQTALTKLTEPGIRVGPLLKLAEISALPEVIISLTHARHPEVMSAQRLLAEMISTSDWESRESGSGTWLITLPTVGKVDQPALQHFGDMLLARCVRNLPGKST